MNREHFEQFMQRPGMFVGRPTYDRIIVWLIGVDFGSEGHALLGFREWIFTKMEERFNTGWEGAVVQHAIRQYGRTFQPNNPEDDEVLIQHLFQLLQEYLNDRDRSDGLKRIYVRYQRMLEARHLRSGFRRSGVIAHVLFCGAATATPRTLVEWPLNSPDGRPHPHDAAVSRRQTGVR